MTDANKNILITPNVSQPTVFPKIEFTGFNNNTVTLSVLDDGTLSFSGSSGQLFSISDSLVGTIFSVNDISGIPSIEVEDDGTVRLAEFAGNVGIGIATPTEKLDVVGNIAVSGTVDGRDVALDGTNQDDHIASTLNPHSVTKAQVGLGSADNTSDADKPVSTAQQTALDLKLNSADLTKTAIDALNVDADTLGGLYSSGYWKTLASVIDVNSVADGGISSPFDDAHVETQVTSGGTYRINYTGASAHLITSNAGGSASIFQIGAHYNGSDFYMRTRTDSTTWRPFRKLWHNGNDGSGSGMDADLLDGQHGAYYTDYTDTAVANLIATAPATLDTLNELAAALGDDPNFATTIANSLALKAPLADPTFTGTVSGITKAMVGLGSVDNTTDLGKPISTATQTALDGKQASGSYATAVHTHTSADLPSTFANNVDGGTNLPYKFDLVIYGDSDKYYPVHFAGGNQNMLRTIKLWRSYSEQGPDDWNTATHKGSLNLEFKANYGSWGGASYQQWIYEHSEQYSTLFGGTQLVDNAYGMAIFLRGGGVGGAKYHIASDMALSWNIGYLTYTEPTPFYNGAADKTFAHATVAYEKYAPAFKTTPNTAQIRAIRVAKGLGVTQTTDTATATVLDKVVIRDGLIDSLSTRTLTPADIGAQAAGSYSLTSHTHSYLPLTGGNLTGTLGLGTSSPSSLLHLYDSTNTSGSTTGTTLLTLDNYVGSDLSQQKIFIDFRLFDDNTNETPQVRIGAEVGANTDANNQAMEGEGAFVVYTNDTSGTSGTATGLNERLRVSSNGNVGIGIATPTEKLDVVGNIAVSGTVDGRDIALDGTNQDDHIASTANPHSVTKAQVGLGSVDNTSDTDKPVSTAQQNALDLKLNLTGGTLSGDLNITKVSPIITLKDNDGVTGTYPRIDFETSNLQGVGIHHVELDGELPVGGYGLVVGPSLTNGQFPTTGTLSLNVLGEIYAGGTTLGTLNAVYHAGNFESGTDYAPAHTHPYLSDTGGTLTGALTVNGNTTLGNAVTDTVTLNGKTTTFSTSSTWDGVGFGQYTALKMQGHAQFWIGAGNGTWFKGVANTKDKNGGIALDASQAHDLLITTMIDSTTNQRGITFAAASDGNGTAGHRLGKWHSGSTATNSHLVVDGQLFAKGGRNDGSEADYYADDFSVYRLTGSAAWAGTGMNKPAIVASQALMIQSGNTTTSTVNPQLQFHKYGYGGPTIEYTGSKLNIDVDSYSSMDVNGLQYRGNTVYHAGNFTSGAGAANWSAGNHTHAASSLTGTTLAAGVTASSLTSVGILTSLSISGDLTVSGTTTTLNSTTVTIDDPVFTLGGDVAPTVDDNKDRGIEFRYFDTAARIGFFGYDDSTNRFTAIGLATNTSEVFSGTTLDAEFGTVYAALSGNASTATWADTVDVNPSDVGANEYPLVWSSGDTLFSSTHFTIHRDSQRLTTPVLKTAKVVGTESTGVTEKFEIVWNDVETSIDFNFI